MVTTLEHRPTPANPTNVGPAGDLRHPSGTDRRRHPRVGPDRRQLAHPVGAAHRDSGATHGAVSGHDGHCGSPGTHAAGSTELEMLDEVPLLGAAMRIAQRSDRLVAELCEALLDLQAHDVAEAATGIALEQWLAIAGRRTRSDRRMLLTACDALRRLPSLHAAFIANGEVSWGQVRAVALAVERLPRHLDGAIDEELSRTIDATRDDEPDALVSAVNRAVHSATPHHQADHQEAAERGEYLALQPRLDGTGGRLYGDYGPLNFATIDAALSITTDRDEPQDRHGHGGRDDGDDRGVHFGPGHATRSGQGPGSAGHRRAQRLAELCDASLAGGGGVPVPAHGSDAGPNPSGAAMRSRPQLLMRLDLSTLLDRDQMPTELLTHLTGGKLWLNADTARAVIDQRGADLRAIVIDETGGVVGVGRRTRLAPSWLTDATLSLHDTCSHPGCQVAARRCDTDHAQPWHPVRPGDPAGRTDIDQLAPMCEFHNHRKERGGWRTSQRSDGTRRWHHQRTGLTTTTRPATWRAPQIDHVRPPPDPG